MEELKAIDLIACSESGFFKRKGFSKKLATSGPIPLAGAHARNTSQALSPDHLPGLESPHKNLSKFVEEYLQKKSVPKVEVMPNPIFALTRLTSSNSQKKPVAQDHNTLLELVYSKLVSTVLILVPQLGSDLQKVEMEKSSSQLYSSKFANPRAAVMGLVTNRQIYVDDSNGVEVLRGYLSKIPPANTKKAVVLVFRDKERIKSIVRRELEYSKLMLLLNVNTYGNAVIPTLAKAGEKVVGTRHSNGTEENQLSFVQPTGDTFGLVPPSVQPSYQQDYEKTSKQASFLQHTFTSSRGAPLSPGGSSYPGSSGVATGEAHGGVTDNSPVATLYRFILKETNLARRLEFSPCLFLVRTVPPGIQVQEVTQGLMGIHHPRRSAARRVTATLRKKREGIDAILCIERVWKVLGQLASLLCVSWGLWSVGDMCVECFLRSQSGGGEPAKTGTGEQGLDSDSGHGVEGGGRGFSAEAGKQCGAKEVQGRGAVLAFAARAACAGGEGSSEGG